MVSKLDTFSLIFDLNLLSLILFFNVITQCSLMQHCVKARKYGRVICSYKNIVTLPVKYTFSFSDEYEKCEKSSHLLSADQLQKSVEEGLFSNNLKIHARREELLKNEDPNSPFFLMANKFKQLDDKAFQLLAKSQMQLEITKSLRSQYKFKI